ncbi:hypothetical protein TIFTF001_044548 [Ficus carica]|uniref:Uncharacterized protein n=1 Tax=Ficus carica TaxID=3494 RepID=A0AA87ZQY2_FICCA|nr:hypothetical protein TIFTF001_044548 [Ficus carica]
MLKSPARRKPMVERPSTHGGEQNPMVSNLRRSRREKLTATNGREASLRRPTGNRRQQGR